MATESVTDEREKTLLAGRIRTKRARGKAGHAVQRGKRVGDVEGAGD